MKFFVYLGVIAAVFLFWPFLVLGCFWSAWWVAPVWNAFMAPTFGLPVLAVWQFALLALLLGYFTHQPDGVKAEYKDPAWETLLVGIFYGPFTWLTWQCIMWWVRRY